jgi:hypothetical protein
MELCGRKQTVREALLKAISWSSGRALFDLDCLISFDLLKTGENPADFLDQFSVGRTISYSHCLKGWNMQCAIQPDVPFAKAVRSNMGLSRNWVYICIYIIHNGNILYYDTPICNHVNIYIIYSTLHTYIYIVPYIYIHMCIYIYTHIHDFMPQLFRLYHHKSHKIWLVYNLPIFRITSQCRKAEKPRICSSSFQTWRSLSVLSSLFIQNMGVNIGYPKIVIWWSKCRSTIKIFDILF